MIDGPIHTTPAQETAAEQRVARREAISRALSSTTGFNEEIAALQSATVPDLRDAVQILINEPPKIRSIVQANFFKSYRFAANLKRHRNDLGEAKYQYLEGCRLAALAVTKKWPRYKGRFLKHIATVSPETAPEILAAFRLLVIKNPPAADKPFPTRIAKFIYKVNDKLGEVYINNPLTKTVEALYESPRERNFHQGDDRYHDAGGAILHHWWLSRLLPTNAEALIQKFAPKLSHPYDYEFLKETLRLANPEGQSTYTSLPTFRYPALARCLLSANPTISADIIADLLNKYERESTKPAAYPNSRVHAQQTWRLITEAIRSKQDPESEIAYNAILGLLVRLAQHKGHQRFFRISEAVLANCRKTIEELGDSYAHKDVLTVVADAVAFIQARKKQVEGSPDIVRWSPGLTQDKVGSSDVLAQRELQFWQRQLLVGTPNYLDSAGIEFLSYAAERIKKISEETRQELPPFYEQLRVLLHVMLHKAKADDLASPLQSSTEFANSPESPLQAVMAKYIEQAAFALVHRPQTGSGYKGLKDIADKQLAIAPFFDFAKNGRDIQKLATELLDSDTGVILMDRIEYLPLLGAETLRLLFNTCQPKQNRKLLLLIAASILSARDAKEEQHSDKFIAAANVWRTHHSDLGGDDLQEPKLLHFVARACVAITPPISKTTESSESKKQNLAQWTAGSTITKAIFIPCIETSLSQLESSGLTPELAIIPLLLSPQGQALLTAANKSIPGNQLSRLLSLITELTKAINGRAVDENDYDSQERVFADTVNEAVYKLMATISP